MKKQLIKRFMAVLLFFSVVISGAGLQGKGLNAATVVTGRLITVGGRTVTSTMKIADIKAMFGEPKLETSSYWGGRAYTFYGENYSDYLYLETYADGSIACYGSVSDSFETNTLSFGDIPNNTVRVGTEATDYDGKLYGLVCYTDYHPDAYEIFGQNLVQNNRSICRHATEMWNAISELYGYHTPTTYNERLFNINAQLAENGSDWYEYCNNTERSSYFQLCSSGGIVFSGYEYPNPLAFAQSAKNYKCKTGYSPAFIYFPASGNGFRLTTGFINPDVIAEWEKVPYTKEEQELLEKVQKEYMDSLDTFNSQTRYYDIEPKFDQLPLTGGKLSDNAARGAVGYLNSIRVGAGLNPLEYSEELSIAAQCKSTYVMYLSGNGYQLANPHLPPQIEGVDDAYYEKCQAGSGENLFMCGILSTNIIGSISNALDDSYGVGEYYSRGHRYNLLDPNWTTIGLGNTMQQGCHKMSGYAASDVEVVAWPSKGVLPVESGFNSGGMMTCQFYNGYMGTDGTTVKIHCLNNDLVWTINPAELQKGQDMRVSGRLISFLDNSISFMRGGVYEITFEHLKNAQNEEVSYTYRTVYESAYIDSEGNDVPQSLTLDYSSMVISPGGMKKIKAVLAPATAQNKRIYWNSADPAVAQVNECGEVTALSPGETDITAITEEGGISAACRIRVLAGDVNNDSQVDLTDVQTVLRIALNIVKADAAQRAVADVNNDQKVTIADARILLRTVLKIQ